MATTIQSNSRLRISHFVSIWYKKKEILWWGRPRMSQTFIEYRFKLVFGKNNLIYFKHAIGPYDQIRFELTIIGIFANECHLFFTLHVHLKLYSYLFRGRNITRNCQDYRASLKPVYNWLWFSTVEGSDAETFDRCNGHSDNLGVYHYHQSPGSDNCGDTFTAEVDQFIGEYKRNLWADPGGGGSAG